ncbi:hypothetical protein E2562_002797 [Oryza meyeriana var. granulata]|uniref:Uncharacterized protein n=1 Tax=Oryza meyeriana var. granulata TaxID=110450 RepID=A0A6G1BPX4_9ORYZ|nr:hypothetical protein E2562_002797 [Oryza meyeriana var. granulata]
MGRRKEGEGAAEHSRRRWRNSKAPREKGRREQHRAKKNTVTPVNAGGRRLVTTRDGHIMTSRANTRGSFVETGEVEGKP